MKMKLISVLFAGLLATSIGYADDNAGADSSGSAPPAATMQGNQDDQGNVGADSPNDPGEMGGTTDNSGTDNSQSNDTGTQDNPPDEETY